MAESDITTATTLVENDSNSAVKIPIRQPPPAQVWAATYESGTVNAMEEQSLEGIANTQATVLAVKSQTGCFVIHP